jgi:hypothetical protein
MPTRLPQKSRVKAYGCMRTRLGVRAGGRVGGGVSVCVCLWVCVWVGLGSPFSRAHYCPGLARPGGEWVPGRFPQRSASQAASTTTTATVAHDRISRRLGTTSSLEYRTDDKIRYADDSSVDGSAPSDNGVSASPRAQGGYPRSTADGPLPTFSLPRWCRPGQTWGGLEEME